MRKRRESKINRDGQSSIAALGGTAGAILASSCCIGPLLLISLGASGAWIGKLTALKAYQPFFLILTAVLLGYGFWLVYGSRRESCEDGCSQRGTGRLTKVALWVASALALMAATTNYWAPIFY